MHLNPGSPKDIYRHHVNAGLAVQEHSASAIRIQVCRHYVGLALEACKAQTIVEIGCGCGEISGIYSDRAAVIGCDCNLAALDYAAKTFGVHGRAMNVEASAMPGDLLVCCDVLEHLERPMATFGLWAPYYRAVVISHPIDEPDGFNSSHKWIFNASDFRDWFVLNGFAIAKFETFMIPLAEPITTIVGYGIDPRRNPNADHEKETLSTAHEGTAS